MIVAISAYVTTAVFAISKRLGSAAKGATAVEYGLLVALIAAIIITVVATLGTNLKPGFTNVSNKLPAV